MSTITQDLVNQNWVETFAVGETTWRCPSKAIDGFDVTSILTMTARGSAGNGGAGSTLAGGGGGGGGAYSKKTAALTVTPGTTYTISVPFGGSTGDGWFTTNGSTPPSSTAQGVLAKAGGSGTAANLATAGNSGAGGTAAASVGDTKFSGGAGAGGTGVAGGGGGGGAGNAANGSSTSAAGTGSGGAGGSAGGGAGGDGGTATTTGSGGVTPSGGGGGGGISTFTTGGLGGAGALLITYHRQYAKATSDQAGVITAAQTPTWKSATTVIFAAAGPVAINKPAGSVAGDILIAIFSIYKSPSGVGNINAVDSGWSQVVSHFYTGSLTSLRQVVLYRVVDGSEPASFSFDWNAADGGVGELHLVSGGDAASLPIYATGSGGGAISPVTDSVTTTQANSLVFRSLVHYHGASTASHTPPATYTERTDFEYQPTGAFLSSTTDTLLKATAGATGSATHVCTELTATDYLPIVFVVNPGTTNPMDTMVRAFTGSRSVTDSIPLTSDIETRTLYARRTESDAVPISPETLTRRFMGTRVMPDNIPIGAETVARAFTGSRAESDSIPTTDSLARTFTGARTEADSIPISPETLARRFTATRQMPDSIPLGAESLTRLYVGARAESDNIPTTDSVARLLIYGRTTQDGAADFKVRFPTKVIAGVVYDHETGSPITVAATVRLIRDLDDFPCQTQVTSALGGGVFSFPRDLFDPNTYHYTAEFTTGGGVQVHGISDRGIVPT